MFLWFIALIVMSVILGGLNFLQLYFHRKEKQEIFDRYMTKTFGEYQYYKEQYPEEIKDWREKQKQERKEDKDPNLKIKKEKARDF